MLKAYQKEFIEFAINQAVLQFGEFTLKSGRLSPYFFNAGCFNSGESLFRLGYFYASTLKESGLKYDLLFGPAYKGIPLVSTTAISLARDFNTDVPWVFNRKEAKDHGEGGSLVGAPLAGKVIIVDDVITAGTAIRETIEIILAAGATPVAVMVAIDRQERGKAQLSAIQEVEQEYGIKVLSIVNLSQIIEYLKTNRDYSEHLGKMTEYRDQYGVAV